MKISGIINLIEDIDGLKILKNEPMSVHTSFKIGGNADVFVMPKSDDALASLLKRATENKIPVTVIGAGSNLLVSDSGIRGITIKIGADFSDISVNGEVINAKSGISLAKISAEALKHSLTGFEFASGIPGSLGGAVYMNAGAYGGEMCDVVISTRYMDFSGNIFTLTKDEHDFSYRHSFFSDKSDFVILSSEIKLSHGEKDEIAGKMRELNQKRKDKQPLSFPSAGSAFKRPKDGFAAKLIEDAGLKGCKIGGAEVSEKHSGFIINTGGATACDVKNLLCHVQKTVFEKFGIMLSPEVKFIGDED